MVERTTIIEELARSASSLRYEALSPAATDAAKGAILDQIGVMLVGPTVEWTRAGRELAVEGGCRPQAGIVGTTDRVSQLDAAMVNSMYGHCCEYDDSGYMGSAHPGALTVGPALSVAEAHNRSGKDFLTAVVAGYEVLYVLGRGMTRTLQAMGYHPQSFIGTFGAATVTGWLLGLDEGQFTHALSIAGSHSSGTQEFQQLGGDVKRFHSGMAARGGVASALLAQKGMTGPATIIEGDRGIGRLTARLDDDDLAEMLQVARTPVTEFAVQNRMLKWYPAVGSSQTGIEAFHIVMRDHDLDADQISHVDVHINPHAIPHGPEIDAIEDAVQAQFSLAYSIAVRALFGNNDIAHYLDPELWKDKRILDFGRRVTKVPEQSYARDKTAAGWARFWGARVRVVLNDGTALEHEEQYRKGSSLNPVTSQELRWKFDRLAVPALGASVASEVADLVADLENLDNVHDLVRLLQGAQR